MTDLPPLAYDVARFDGDVALDRASARIRSYCGWHIAPSVTSVLEADTRGGPDLLLPTLRLTDVTAVVIDGVAVDVSAMSWSTAGMLAMPAGQCWPVGYRAATVTFVHGYDEAPAEIVDVVAGLVARIPAQLATVTQETVGGESRTFGAALSGGFSSASGLTIAETNVLDKFRLGTRP